MVRESSQAWSFFTNYALVLMCIARDPDIRLREIGDTIGISERAAHRIVNELAQAGYIDRERVGRRNRYRIRASLRLPDPLAPEHKVGDLLIDDLLGLLHRRPTG